MIIRQESAEVIVVNARSNVRLTAKARTFHKEESYGSQKKIICYQNNHLWRIMEKPALNSTLMDLVVSSENMHKAWKQVRQNGGSPGVDGITIEKFPVHLQNRWKRIRQALLSGYYVPSPVLRVEIPKKSGGKRMLGIPTVLDRVIQQAITQVLSPIFDPYFSDCSFGFRTGKSAHGAVKKVHDYVVSGSSHAVDLDLEKFFDTVNHDILMHLVGLKVKDKCLMRLIGRYLRAGILTKEGDILPSTVGTPQGGPLSPLLSNILLDVFDKELEKRNLRFARYADDAIILIENQLAGEEVLADITQFLHKKLKLIVNEEKSKVVPVRKCSFLGFTFINKKIRWTEEAFMDFRYQIKHLTRRSWGVSMKYRYFKLAQYIRGWMNYYGISEYYRPIPGLDEWLRRRIRMCYWKQWRRCRTKVNNLKKMGVPLYWAIKSGTSSHSYWKMSKTYSTNVG